MVNLDYEGPLLAHMQFYQWAINKDEEQKF